MNKERIRKKYNKLECPNCNGPLMHLMPSGRILHCNACKKYFINENGNVGEETTSPYTDKSCLY